MCVKLGCVHVCGVGDGVWVCECVSCVSRVWLGCVHVCGVGDGVWVCECVSSWGVYTCVVWVMVYGCVSVCQVGV